MTRQFACPCCGFLTLPAQSPGSWEICPVCLWQDDPMGFERPGKPHGPNPISLYQARKNFLVFGACEDRMLRHVRSPLPHERPPRTGGAPNR
jgi:hypothetical protein